MLWMIAVPTLQASTASSHSKILFPQWNCGILPPDGQHITCYIQLTQTRLEADIVRTCHMTQQHEIVRNLSSWNMRWPYQDFHVVQEAGDDHDWPLENIGSSQQDKVVAPGSILPHLGQVIIPCWVTIQKIGQQRPVVLAGECIPHLRNQQTAEYRKGTHKIASQSQSNCSSPSFHPNQHHSLTKVGFCLRKSTSFSRSSWGSVKPWMPSLATWSSKAKNMQFPLPGLSLWSWKPFCLAFPFISLMPFLVGVETASVILLRASCAKKTMFILITERKWSDDIIW